MKLIAYYRVSTVRQGVSALGLEGQQQQVHRYAAEAGGDILAEFTEVESGKLSDRPVLACAMEECRRQRAVLVIAKLDRLARNVAFISRLLESGVEFTACDVPHASRMMLQILSVFAEFERDQISARTKAALSAAKARGVVLGKHGRVLADQHRSKAREFAMIMAEPIALARRDGADTFAKVAEHLNHAGYRTRDGAMWHPMSVSRVVQRLNQPSDA